jgi:16S rRNA processing protein RimM
LIGLSVINETGELIGELSDVLNLPGQDLLAVKTPTGEILIPFVAEFVPEVDIESGRIIVSPPPGLLHLTESADE